MGLVQVQVRVQARPGLLVVEAVRVEEQSLEVVWIGQRE